MTQAPPTTTTYCYNHPHVETHLRCNNCERYICAKCAKLTPTGYRCPDCIRNQQKVFDTAEWWDYPVAFLLAAGLSAAGSFLAGIIGFFVIFLAPAVGIGIAEAVRFAVRRRRSPHLFKIAALGAALGALPAILVILAPYLMNFRPNLIALLWQGIYIFTVTSSVYYRLRGITMR
jgi:hypothetical protein